MLLRVVLCGFFLLCSAPAFSAALITSLSPDNASPGMEITVTGGPFEAGIAVLVGEAKISPQTLEKRRLTFVLPPLPAGLYLLRLADDGRVSPFPLLFRVVAPQPLVTAINPPEFDECITDPHPLVTIKGSGFDSHASLQIDGVAVPVDSIAENQITLTPPPLSAGPHQIVVTNPSGKRSFPRGLLINGTPEIFSAQVGSDEVTSYALILDGKNFLASSQLLVDGKRVPLMQSVPPGQDSATFSDCRTIIYHRHPYSSQPKRIALQVVNPGGKESATTFIQAP